MPKDQHQWNAPLFAPHRSFGLSDTGHPLFFFNGPRVRLHHRAQRLQSRVVRGVQVKKNKNITQ
jgi:hypothetical protein